MHQRAHNRVPQIPGSRAKGQLALSLRFRFGFALSAMRIRLASFLHIVTLLSCLLASSPARAENVSGLMKMKGFGTLAVTIAALNFAMRQAAVNPMDDWRRANVAKVMQLMPAALMGLAADFKSGKLHDDDLGRIQGLLGGFVDVNAADGFKKFMDKPSLAAIPRTGPGFPNIPQSQIDKTVPGLNNRQLGYDDSAAKRKASGEGSGRVLGLENDSSSTSDISPSQLANLSGASSATRGPSKTGTVSGSIGYDESATKSTAAGSAFTGTYNGSGSTLGSNAKGSGASGSGSGGNGGAGFIKEVNRDLSSIEGGGGISGSVGTRNGPAVNAEKKDEDDFFKMLTSGENDKADKDKKAAKEKNGLRHRDGRRADYRIVPQPKYWAHLPLAKLTELVFGTKAFAEAPAPTGPPGGGGAPAAGGGGGCPGGCKNSPSAGGGEGGGGGGQGGQIAAQILMAAAFAMQAIVPAIVAKQQAQADIAITRMNNDTQLQMSAITANTSKYLANTQANIASQQSQLAAQIAQQNNQAQNDRLSMQLNELRQARLDAKDSENQKRALEDKYNMARIQLAQKQASDNVTLAQKTLDANLTQAGLTSGFSNSRNSGDGLTVTQTGLASNGSTAITPSGTLSSGQSGTAASGSVGSQLASLGGGSGASASSGAGAGSSAVGFMTGQKNLAQRGFTPNGKAANQLVASVSKTQPLTEEEEITQKTATTQRSQTRRGNSRGFIGSGGALSGTARGFAGATHLQVSMQLARGIAAGSTPTHFHETAVSTDNTTNTVENTSGSSSDLSRFFEGTNGKPTRKVDDYVWNSNKKTNSRGIANDSFPETGAGYRQTHNQGDLTMRGFLADGYNTPSNDGYSTAIGGSSGGGNPGTANSTH